MKIVVDTNVVISGVFFGGNPRRIIESILDKHVNAYATPEIMEEYIDIIDSMIARKQGKLDRKILFPLFASFNVINGKSNIELCRDPDDDKFLECAVDAEAIYIVSGDLDLLDISNYKGIQIITAKEFCEKHLL